MYITKIRTSALNIGVKIHIYGCKAGQNIKLLKINIKKYTYEKWANQNLDYKKYILENLAGSLKLLVIMT